MFPSFAGGGFECTTHIRGDGRRLDLVSGTSHDLLAAWDYAALADAGLLWARDGLRWNLIELRSGQRSWASWHRQLYGAAAAGVEVWWDLIHFGLPGWCDPWLPAFPTRAAEFAAAAAREQLRITGRPGLFCPINEISFWAFAGGEVGWFHPHAHRRGVAFKERLVAASIAMVHAIRSEDPAARILWAEPLIHIAPSGPPEAEAARLAEDAQFEAIDWLTGRSRPDLGGAPTMVDVVGLNHYPHNQRMLDHSLVGFGTPRFRPLSDMLADCAARYPSVPLVLSETGAEGAARAPWLHYIRQEALEARGRGVPIEGACLYPVTDYPGWDDDRLCPTGLFGIPRDSRRQLHMPTLDALRQLERELGAEVRQPPD